MKRLIFTLPVLLLLMASCDTKLGKQRKADKLQFEAIQVLFRADYNEDSVQYAFKLMKEAHRLTPNGVNVNQYMCRFYLYERKYDSARYYLWKNFKNDSTLAESYANIGVCFEHEGIQDSADFYYTKAYDLYGSRFKQNEIYRASDLCKQAFMLTLIENDPQKGIDFIQQQRASFSDAQAVELLDNYKEGLAEFNREEHFDKSRLFH